MRTAIFDIENWREIGATLSRNKTRTFLTAFGIFWGTAMLAMLLGGESGLERKLMSNFEGFATNCAVFDAGRRTISYNGFNKGSDWTMTSDDAEAIRRGIPEIEALAENANRGAVPVTDGLKSTTATVQGVSPEFPRIFLPDIYAGRFINESDEVATRKVCVIGRSVSEKIFGVGDPVGRFLNVGGIYYRIVGMAGQTAEVQMGGSKIDDSVIIPISTMRRSFNMGNEIGTCVLLARDGISPSLVRPRIERIVAARHQIHPDDHNALWFFDVAEQFEMVDHLFAGVTFLAMFVGISSLVAGIIGVGNIMWVIVKERTNEIGIRRAIGARPSDIVTQILSEGLVLTLVAGMAGVVFATIVLAIVNKATGPGFELPFDRAMTIIVTFMLLGAAAGLIPALKSMKIKPIEAINDK
ncbi:MAG: ABC transporter permease [Muribaculaceae bacterium]|nr:ABC transporter permease [Muribaculaceae bacterium]